MGVLYFSLFFLCLENSKVEKDKGQEIKMGVLYFL